jgi:hypothetical protein
MTKLELIIEGLLQRFQGGETYFDNFDATLLEKENLDIVLSLVAGIKGNIILTGKFGRYVYDLFNDGKLCREGVNIYHFPGSLRGNGEVHSVLMNFFKGDIPSKEAIFIDDSFYSGTTRRKIQEYLTERLSMTIVKTLVVYDGSIEKDNTVFSLYRYHK